MSSPGTYIAERAPLRGQLAYRLRILRVLSRTEFKLKYAGSALGYVWSLAKPLLYFLVLWVVFGRLFRSTIPDFPVYLLIGIVIYTFLADAVALAVPSIVVRGSILRRIAFPSVVIPIATTASSALTFLLNSVAVVVFIAVDDVVPRANWVLLIPLAVEITVFVLGVALAFSALYVRFRDVGQIWEVLATVLLFTSPIMYPMGILPTWAQKAASCDPLVQVIQDARRLILGVDPRQAEYLALAVPRAIPLAVTVVVAALGVWLHRRESPRFAEVA